MWKKGNWKTATLRPMRSQLLHSTWFLISTQFLITTYLQQHLISWFPWFTWYSCSVLNTFSLVHATDMQSIVELVWSFFYPTHLNQIDPLWQPLICHLKHLWQKLILVWHLCILHQYYHQIVICFCSTAHFCLTSASLQQDYPICSHHLYLIICLDLIHHWLTCFIPNRQGCPPYTAM